jgi:2-haloacid dehalogenase
MVERREKLKGAAALAAKVVVTKSVGAQAQEDKRMRRPEALFFDSNESMLDLRGMKPQVKEAFNGRDDLMALWFSTMLFHSQVDTVTANYHDFGTIGAACMQMVAEGHGIKLDKEKAKKAMAAMKTLPAHPDVPPGLKKMKEAGFRMYTLTNSAALVMESQVKNAGIGQYFDGKLSVEGLNIYKPHPRTYHWAAHHAGVPIGNCMLIAAHGWDVAGATLAGMRAAFLERPGKTLYPLGPDIELSGRDMVAVADQLLAMPK